MKIVLAALNAKYTHINLAIRYLRQKAKEYKFDTHICEFTINDNISNIIRELYSEKADVYGFSVYIWNTEMICKISKELKKLLPDSMIFFGGPESSNNSKFYLDNYYCDYVLKGDGEGVIIPFLSDRNNQNIPGVCGKDFDNGFAPTVDFSQIPYPFEEGEIEKLSGRLIYYETSRGCPYRCAYCLSGNDRKVNALPKEQALSNLLKLNDSGAGIIKLVDRTFNFDRERARYIWKGLIDAKVKSSYHFEICAELLEEEDFQILKDAPENIFLFEIGIQSTNEKTLKEVNRNNNLDKLLNNIKRLRDETKVHLHIDLIAGLPFEDYTSFKKSFNDVYPLSEELQMGFLKVLYGSAMKEKADKEGYLYQSFPPYEVMATPWLSFDEMIKLKMIEETLERYSNSGHFSASLEFVFSDNKDYFGFFERFSLFLEEKNSLFSAVSKKREFTLLLEYIEKVFPKEKFEIFKEVLRFDFTRNFKGEHQIFEYKYPENYKELIYSFLSVEENIIKYIPWAKDEKLKNITKFIDIHVFKFYKNKIFIFDRKSDKIIEITNDFKLD